jgi:hypothetical protein
MARQENEALELTALMQLQNGVMTMTQGAIKDGHQHNDACAP